MVCVAVELIAMFFVSSKNATRPVVKVRGPGGSAPFSGLSSPAVNEKVLFYA